jgi:nucleoside-diphosphate-sugar epimerase
MQKGFILGENCLNNILVTGGAGFIGSHLCMRLLKKNYKPVVYDAFVQYISPFESSYQKFLDFRFLNIKKKIIFERGDVRDKGDIQRVILKYKPKIIFHLAAMPIADLGYTHPEEAISSILNSTVNLLETIRNLDFIERFIYISSSMIYGDFIEIPTTEDHRKQPKDIYGGTKLAGEILTEAYSRRHGIKYTIVRPSAVYGPTDVNRRVIQIFLEKAIKGENLVLNGGEKNIIDFTYIDDIADGLMLAGFSKGGENQQFNITGGRGRSLVECANIISNYFPSISYEVKPMDKARPIRGTLSIQKAKDLLGYEPKYSLEEGIQRYVQFYRDMNG